MHSFKTILVAALLSTVIATPLKDRAVDVDTESSIEIRDVAGSRSGNNDCDYGDKSRLDSEIRNRQQMKDRLDAEINRRQDIKAQLDEEIRRKQNSGCRA
ncbi:hypothetical protein CkaCkLH20_07663 [Colletotrichum karsti]|uniref:EC8 protein n=1 Tax=Colletotrichum karsti TaxID=1095194 RepID=A0A9P6I2C9_9PEZI|nr:uncharacterized protein CkaCkLH20_07663 [Colletotrichum karsti]KAF9874969.1 hypothetical protein CkaCkLH20_07663 [Colletotrichum karsti]